MLHTTSLIRYPVFMHNRNYTGVAPIVPLASPLLWRYVREVFVSEVAALPQAMIIPLGKAVTQVCAVLEEEGMLAAGRCLQGFPNPSGANGHRMRQFEQSRTELHRSLTQWFAARKGGDSYLYERG